MKSISPKIKLLFEENEQNTDYLIPLDKNNSVKLVKVQEKKSFVNAGIENGVISNKIRLMKR